MNEPGSTEYLALQSAVEDYYVLGRPLGRGGMGVVYLADDLALDRPVALKFLPPEKAKDLELRERFIREARVAARLAHPNIVPIHTVAEEGGFVFFAMGYVDGETLLQRVKDSGPLEIVDAVQIIREVASALHYAHENGVIHRDVKPENVLLDKQSGRAVVTDFGVARAVGAESLTAAGEIFGTASYMSPEQLAGDRVDARSDIYSLGIVAYYMLTGTLPFTAPTVPELLVKHLMDDPPSVSSVRSEVPALLASAVDKCLEKDREDRFTTAADFSNAIIGNYVGTNSSGGFLGLPRALFASIRRARRRAKRKARVAFIPKTERSNAVGAPTESLNDVFLSLDENHQSTLAEALKIVEAVNSRIEALKKREAELDATLAEATGNTFKHHVERLEELRNDPDKEREAALLDRRVSAVSQIEDERRRVEQRMASAVAAVENIRVALLRLRSGVGSIGEVADDLDAAKAIGDDAEGFLTGRSDIDRQSDAIVDEIYRY